MSSDKKAIVILFVVVHFFIGSMWIGAAIIAGVPTLIQAVALYLLAATALGGGQALAKGLTSGDQTA